MKYDKKYDGNWQDENRRGFSHLTEEEQNELLEWIRLCIRPRKTPLLTRSSYGIKHIYQHDTSNYVTNAQFKDAMIISGYEPVDRSQLNHCYCLSKKSPSFDNRLRNPQWYSGGKYRRPEFNYREFKVVQGGGTE